MSMYHGTDFVCADCFNDDGMRAFIADRVTSKKCDFCGARKRKAIAAPLDEVIDHISGSIRHYYDDPSNAGLAYESREGGWQGTTYTTDEVFEALDLDFPNDKDDRLRDAVASGLESDLWSDAEPYRLNRYERFRYSWEHFCEVTKHKLRYFFAQDKRDDDEIYDPSEVLELIFSHAERVGAFTLLPCGSLLYRARYQPNGEAFASAGQLGPPPVESAIQTNRMSPPGIVMTYLADDVVTALAETASQPGSFAVGTFITERDALILDLTRLPPVPSIFTELPDPMGEDQRPPLIFLHGISLEISRPIARDDRVHIEYVPTQVVTEYVRTALTVDGRRIDGIRYRSSRRAVKTALVLFADRENIVFEKEEQGPFYYSAKDQWLRLQSATVSQVTSSDIALWFSATGRSWLGIRR